MKILLCNWTHRNNTAGGTENRYQYLKQVFPEAELISYEDLFGKVEDLKQAAERMDEYYLKRYKDNILIIRDAEVGGVLDISKIPQIVIFGNPYNSLNEIFDFGRSYWKDLIELQKRVRKAKTVAVSNFMKEDMKKIGITPDEIIPNPVDIDFFKPVIDKEMLRRKYNLPNKKIAIWVGSTDNLMKNFQMIFKLIIKFQNIFWILVTKNKTSVVFRNVKIFYNVDKNTILELYNSADFFILTSPIEGCSHAVFEAMACNLPCIVSKAGYFWDFWDERIGISVEWNDINAHIDAINRISEIRTKPRQVIIDQRLDLKNWKKRWRKLVWKL